MLTLNDFAHGLESTPIEAADVLRSGSNAEALTKPRARSVENDDGKRARLQSSSLRYGREGWTCDLKILCVMGGLSWLLEMDGWVE